MVKCGACGWHGTIGEANTGQDHDHDPDCPVCGSPDLRLK